MSVTDNPAPKLDPGPAPARPLFRRPLFVGVALAAVVVAAAVVTVVVWPGGDSGPDPATISKTAPITLPATISGLAATPEAADFARQPVWLDRARAAAPGVTVAGRSYGSPKERRQIRVVAGRADLTGKLEFTWAADEGHVVRSAQGEARCTKNLLLAARGTAQIRPTMMFCWRTEKALSAYGVVIDFDHEPGDADGLAALDAAWAAALTPNPS